MMSLASHITIITDILILPSSLLKIDGPWYGDFYACPADKSWCMGQCEEMTNALAMGCPVP